MQRLARLVGVVLSMTLAVSVSDAGCFVCIAPNETDILSIAGYMSMCPESPLWGVELNSPFVSKRKFFGLKFWQARTVSVRDAFGRVHHILFPFLLNSGGMSVMIGHAAVVILKKFGATARSKDSFEYCNLNVPLPLKDEPCVVQWGAPTPGAADHDRGHDVREFALSCSLLASCARHVWETCCAIQETTC
jgi:hypothetical protein